MGNSIKLSDSNSMGILGQVALEILLWKVNIIQKILLIFYFWFSVPNCPEISRTKYVDTLRLKCLDSSCKQYL